jgi:hypothetical protein
VALTGDGFLAMWHDIASEAEEEYNLWHTQEHMPERVGIPGFKVARRYVDWNLELHRYFTLYEGQAIETFDSPDYIARLNAPTSWTQKMMPAFRNMVRGACRTVATVGTGIGGALATLRFSSTDGTATSMPEVAQGLVGHVLTLRGVIAVHIGVVDHKVTGVPTNEREMRQATNEDASMSCSWLKASVDASSKPSFQISRRGSEPTQLTTHQSTPESTTLHSCWSKMLLNP